MSKSWHQLVLLLVIDTAHKLNKRDKWHYHSVSSCCCTSQVAGLQVTHAPSAGNGITIRERPAASKDNPEPADAEERQRQSDADYALQLQAKLNAQEVRGGSRYSACSAMRTHAGQGMCSDAV